jgi:peptidoglycan hydrolase CwlO-like protein
MKKFISGVVVGALLMVSTQAFGANINFIGKKVAGETVVTINEQEVGKAIVIDGKSFAPVREITEGFGGKVDKANSEVIALTTEQTNTTTTPSNTPSVDVTNLEKAINKKKEEVADTKHKITVTSEKVEHYTGLISSAKNDVYRQNYQNSYDAFKKSLDQLEVALKDQETELADLESQLAELQK